MDRFNRMLALVMLSGALAFGACSGEADVDVDNDSAGVDADVDVNDTVGTIDTAGGPDVNVDSAQGATDGEGIEKLVEAKLIASPGFSGVTVESEGEGVIVLNGTVASADEKARAETVTKEVAGVTSVKNNLTVQ
jgi:hypothetical protein